jgi:hypothetical protein
MVGRQRVAGRQPLVVSVRTDEDSGDPKRSARGRKTQPRQQNRDQGVVYDSFPHTQPQQPTPP